MDSLEKILSDAPPTKESILKIKKAIIEFKRQKRNITSNKNSLNWMNPFHRKFHDNSSTIQLDKNKIQHLIDLCNYRIEEIKVELKQ